MVRDLIVETLTADDGELHISEGMLEAITNLRKFLYDNVYTYPKVHAEFEKAQRIIRDLYSDFMQNGLVRLRGEKLEKRNMEEEWTDEKVAHRRVCDYIAGMTDRYALSIYKRIFLPEPWSFKD